MSHAGNAWKECYANNLITWCEPDRLTYEHLERFSKSEWVKSLQKFLPSPRREIKILEAGCGLGLYSLSLAILGYRNIEAFDYSEQAIRLAADIQEKVKIQNDQRVRFFQGDLLAIQKPAASYDFVFNQAVLEYFCVEEETKKVLSELVRIVKPGGRVVLIVQHTQHPFRNYWKKLGWRGYEKQPEVTDWSPKKLKQSLIDAGLQDVCISGLQPWKAFFFWPQWHLKSRALHQLVYLAGRFFEKLPWSDGLRAYLGIQLIGSGTKP